MVGPSLLCLILLVSIYRVLTTGGLKQWKTTMHTYRQEQMVHLLYADLVHLLNSDLVCLLNSDLVHLLYSDWSIS